MLSESQLKGYQSKGYLVLPELFSNNEMNELMGSANAIVEQFDPDSTRSIFTTDEKTRAIDDYFLTSEDKIRCFFEEDAFDAEGRLSQDKALSINKIGHALHHLDPTFKRFSHDNRIKTIANQLGLVEPQIWQSMYIFKQPKIGGVIRWHQDATYFFTRPQSVITFWFAVEDATVQNGCLQIQNSERQIPLKEQFKRYPDDTTELVTLHEKPWPSDDEAMPLEVKKGTLVVFNGELPHFSAPNVSDKSRHAYTLHITCGTADYSAENWLQAAPSLL